MGVKLYRAFTVNIHTLSNGWRGDRYIGTVGRMVGGEGLAR